MLFANWVSLLVFGMVFCTATVSFGLSHISSHFPDSGKMIQRLPRNINSKCGTDFIFDYFGVRSEINRTHLSILMKKISIGYDVRHKNTDCNEVFCLN